MVPYLGTQHRPQIGCMNARTAAIPLGAVHAVPRRLLAGYGRSSVAVTTLTMLLLAGVHTQARPALSTVILMLTGRWAVPGLGPVDGGNLASEEPSRESRPKSVHGRDPSRGHRVAG